MKPNLNVKEYIVWTDQSNVHTTHSEFELWLKFYKFLQTDMMKPHILMNRSMIREFY